MTDSERFDMLRQVLAARVEPEIPTPDCLDEDLIAALAEGSLDAPARAEAVRHLAACPRCRRAVASVAQALADRSVAREARAAGTGWRRAFRIALPAAAAAALLVLVWSRPADDGGTRHRAPPDAGAAPVLVAPVGAVAQAPVLVWTPVAGAHRYRVTLFDAQGQVLYETQLGDTVATVPDSIVLAPGRPYLWKVEARTGFDRWSASDLVGFSIAGHTPP